MYSLLGKHFLTLYDEAKRILKGQIYRDILHAPQSYKLRYQVHAKRIPTTPIYVGKMAFAWVLTVSLTYAKT